jgi:type VI secretion system protein ImpM
MPMRHLPGWYGKIGAVGDFASRRLTDEQVQIVDRWLTGVMTASQGALGQRWLSAYLSAPLWRFAWGPGVLDAQWWFGALMPSCDKVGRYFPLLLLQPRSEPPLDRLALNHLELWWRKVAEAALATLSEHAMLDDFERSLAHVPPWPTSGAVPRPAGQTVIDPVSGRVCEVRPLGARDGIADWMSSRAALALIDQFKGRSLWWPYRLGPPQPPIRLIHGLPDGQEFAALIGSED